MLKELDVVALTAPVPAEGLEAGDAGTVVYIHDGGRAFEVEFTTLEGETVAVATVEASQVRPVSPREITHAREMAARCRQVDGVQRCDRAILIREARRGTVCHSAIPT